MIDSKLRFEIFKRDSFTCQYCGRSAPEVELQVEHIIAKANGGTDDVDNLMTSCSQCNYAKNANPISNDSYLPNLFEIQVKNLSGIRERKEQFRLFTLYKKELETLQRMEVNEIFSIIPAVISDNDNRHAFKIKNLIKKYGFNVVYEATERCVGKFFDIEDHNLLAWDIDYYLPIMCRILTDKNTDVNTVEVQYLIEIIRKKLFDGYLKEIYNPEKDILPGLLDILKNGYHPKTKEDLCIIQILSNCISVCNEEYGSKESKYARICKYINDGENPCEPY